MTFNFNLKLYIKGPNKTIFRTKSTNQDQAQMGGCWQKISTNLWPIPCLKLNTIWGWSRKYFPRICRLQIWVCNKLIHPLDLTVTRWPALKYKFGTESLWYKSKWGIGQLVSLFQTCQLKSLGIWCLSIKSLRCFERGKLQHLSCFGIKGFKYLSCFGIKCKRFKYFSLPPPSANNVDWGQDLARFRDLLKYIWKSAKKSSSS